MKVEKVLVPIDFSQASRAALQAGVDLAEKFGATVEVLHVWSPPMYVPPESMFAIPGWNPMSLEQYARAEAVKEMEAFMASFDRGEVKVKRRVEIGLPGAVILKVASENHVDLIVVGTHGRTGVGRLLMGSVAQHVVAKAACPVLAVKADEVPAP